MNISQKDEGSFQEITIQLASWITSENGKMVKGSLLLQFLLTARFLSVIHAEWISIYGHSWPCLAVKRKLAFCDYCIENILQSNDFWKSEYSALIYANMHIHSHIRAHTRIYVICTTAPFYSILNYDSMYWDISEASLVLHSVPLWTSVSFLTRQLFEMKRLLLPQPSPFPQAHFWMENYKELSSNTAAE